MLVDGFLRSLRVSPARRPSPPPPAPPLPASPPHAPAAAAATPGDLRLPALENRVRDDRLHRVELQVLGGPPGPQAVHRVRRAVVLPSSSSSSSRRDSPRQAFPPTHPTPPRLPAARPTPPRGGLAVAGPGADDTPPCRCGYFCSLWSSLSSSTAAATTRAGQLDTAIFDAVNDTSITLSTSGVVLGPGTVKNPVCVVANYLFDTLCHDIFQVTPSFLTCSTTDRGGAAREAKKHDDDDCGDEDDRVLQNIQIQRTEDGHIAVAKRITRLSASQSLNRALPRQRRPTPTSPVH